MLNIKVICVGKSKEKYWDAAYAEYLKRLRAYCSPEVIEVREARLPANASPADERNVIDAEGRDILGRISGGDFVIALDIRGKEFSSEELHRRSGRYIMIRTDDDEGTIKILNRLGVGRIEKEADGTLRVSEQLDNTVAMAKAIVEGGIALQEICLNSVSLEDYYLGVTEGGEHNG